MILSRRIRLGRTNIRPPVQDSPIEIGAKTLMKCLGRARKLLVSVVDLMAAAGNFVGVRCSDDVADTVPLPLLALMQRRLRDDEVAEVVAELICRRQPTMDAVDIGVAITGITGELPSVTDIENVQTVLSNALTGSGDWDGLANGGGLKVNHGRPDIYIDERINVVDGGAIWLMGLVPYLPAR